MDTLQFVCYPKVGVLERFSADEGFEGGYDWNSLALVFLLEKNARGFKAACEDRKLITDLFSRAQLN